MRSKMFRRGIGAALLLGSSAVAGNPWPQPGGTCNPPPACPTPFPAAPSTQVAPQTPGAQTPAPESASTAQQPPTDALAQAPPSGGEAAQTALPQMIGDLGFYGLAPRIFGSSTGQTVIPGLTAAQINQRFNLSPQFPFTSAIGIPINRITYTDLTTGQTFSNAQLVALTRPTVVSSSSSSSSSSLSSRVPVTSFGAFKISDNESPVPTDRVFATYNYYDVDRLGGNSSSLNREVIGFEKTFFDGQASFELRAPYTQVGEGLGGSSDLDALTMVFKYALFNDRQRGNVIAGGLAVTVPTGPDILVFTNEGSVATVNATLLQPYVGYAFNFGSLYVEGFSEIVVPTDARLPTFVGNDIGVGYRLDSLPIIPTFEVHANDAFNHQGSLATPFGFVDEVVLTGGFHALFGRSTFTIGVGTPVTGPRIYSVECIAQLNCRF